MKGGWGEVEERWEIRGLGRVFERREWTERTGGKRGGVPRRDEKGERGRTGGVGEKELEGGFKRG